MRLAMCVGGMLLAAQISVVAQVDGLALYLQFDEGAGNVARDASGNGHEAALINSPKLVNGKIGKALELAGGAYIEVPDSPDSGFDNVKELTIELWARQATTHDNGIVVKLLTPAFWPCSYNLETWGDSNIWFGVDSDASAVSAPGYPLNEWYHLAAVFDGGAQMQTIYLNGKKVAEGAAPTDTVPDGDMPIYIGTVTPANHPFLGAVDEVAIYSRALSAAEIQADMGGISLAVEPSGKLGATWGDLKRGN